MFMNSDYEYDHGTIDKRTIEAVFDGGNQEMAIKRAEDLEHHFQNTNPIEANPSTLVHLLVKEIISWIDYFAYTS